MSTYLIGTSNRYPRKNMNLKQRRYLSAATFCAAILTLASSYYSEEARTQATNLPKLNQVAQILWQLGDNNRPVTIVDRAVYSLDDPALQFIYSPNQFVVESFAPSLEDAAQATVNRINIWSKEDYVAFIKVGEEAGDLSPGLTLSIHENPAGLPLVDFVTTQPDKIANPNIESFESKPIAGQEGLSFTHSDILWSYQSTVLKDINNDNVILISLRGSKTESPSTASVGYYEAFEKIEASLKLSNASVDAYKE